MGVGDILAAQRKRAEQQAEPDQDHQAGENPGTARHADGWPIDEDTHVLYSISLLSAGHDVRSRSARPQ
jgi:hypothetical protein